jgi:hypothetical protein
MYITVKTYRWYKYFIPKDIYGYKDIGIRWTIFEFWFEINNKEKK